MPDITKGHTFVDGESVTHTKLNNIVDNASLNAGVVNTTELASGAVSTVKIADDAVSADKLADTAVSAGAYTTADITVDAQGRVTAAASGTIAVAEIEDNSVTLAKLEDGTAGDVLYYGASGAPSRLTKGVAGKVLKMDSSGDYPEWADDIDTAGTVLQVVVAASSTSATTTAAIPADDTIPQSDEGTAYDSLDCAITPTASDSKLLIQVVMPNATNDSSGGYGMVVALFRDSATDALAVSEANHANNNAPYPMVMTYYDNAVSTSATTYKIRFAVTNGGTARLNQRYGASAVSTIVVTEISA